MKAHHLCQFVLAIATVGVLAGPSFGEPPPTGYRVYSWGYYDRFPYPSPIGSTFAYTDGKPVVSYVDPWGRVVDMPLRPKVLYDSTPFLTSGGYYYPVSITVMPEPVRRPPTVLVRPAPPISFQYDPSKRAQPPPAEPPIPKARDFDAPARPELPPAATAPVDSKLPAVPKLPTLPKSPPVPGVPNLGPGPSELPPPAKKPG